MSKKLDWKGNGSTIVCLGAHNYSGYEREKHDYYATNPVAIKKLLEVENLENVWEPAAGGGHMAKVLDEANKLGLASDLIDRGYGKGNIDFLESTGVWDGDIVTNPPYRYAKEFILKALELLPIGRKVCMFLRIQFLESKGRYQFYQDNPPKIIYVFSGRVGCAMNGEFGKHSQTAVPYAWYVWVKGCNDDPIVKWILI